MEPVVIILGAIVIVAIVAVLIVRSRRTPSGRPLDTPERVEARVDEMAEGATPDVPPTVRDSERRDASGLRAPGTGLET